jgi:cell division septation protein DedD
MNDNRRDDPNQEDSADQDWTPWMDDDASDDDLPSFSHDSEEDTGDNGDAARRDAVEDDILDDLAEYDSDDPTAPAVAPVPPVLPVTGQTRPLPQTTRYPDIDAGDDASPDNSDYEDGWEEDEFEEEVHYDTQPARFTDTWPIGLIAVAALALVLLAAGGYGVMKQRAAMEQQIRELQAQLAVAAKPDDVSDARASLETLQAENSQLSDNLAALRDENRQLSDTLAGLEQQLTAQRAATARATPAAASKPAAPKPAPAAAKPAPAASGDWFVNFGSYSERSVAERWSTRIKPGAGRVTVSSAQRDGETFYRVRVIGLASDSAAQTVARQLEREYDLSKLWVGKE